MECCFFLVWVRVICGLYKKVQCAVEKQTMGIEKNVKAIGMKFTTKDQQHTMVPTMKIKTKSKLENNQTSRKATTGDKFNSFVVTVPERKSPLRTVLANTSALN